MLLLVSACATTTPKSIDEVAFRTRSQTQMQGDLTVTVAVPTREEALDIYGVDLAERNMQAVWLEINNDGPLSYWFLPTGLDPAYFPPAEAAFAFEQEYGGELGNRFQGLDFINPVRPGTTVSGFVIVNREEAFKAVDVDLIGDGDARSFTYIVADPGFRGDYVEVDFGSLYSAEQLIDVDSEQQLRQQLETMPCCTGNEDGSEQGDPLNLVLIGDREDIFPAFIRRGWHGTEVIWSKAVWRTVKAFLQGSRYRYSPVSPLYVYDRKQDLAAQKARGTIHQRNHLRLWMTPVRFRGKPVWIGQISRDIGVKYTLKSPTISTHVIDPDVDEARRYLLEDLAYSQALAAYGYVSGVGAVSREAPRSNLVGDPYFTDGLRAVMYFEPRPRSLAGIDILDWDLRPLDARGIDKVTTDVGE